MGPYHKRLHAQLTLKKTERRKKKNSFCSEMANMKLILLFLVVIAIGLSSGFELGKNQKEKSALKKLMPMMLVKAKSAKQFKELKRQGAPGYWKTGDSFLLMSEWNVEHPSWG